MISESEEIFDTFLKIYFIVVHLFLTMALFTKEKEDDC